MTSTPSEPLPASLRDKSAEVAVCEAREKGRRSAPVRVALPGTAAIPSRPPRYFRISCWERRGIKLFIIVKVYLFYTRQGKIRTFELFTVFRKLSG